MFSPICTEGFTVRKRNQIDWVRNFCKTVVAWNPFPQLESNSMHPKRPLFRFVKITDFVIVRQPAGHPTQGTFSIYQRSQVPFFIFFTFLKFSRTVHLAQNEWNCDCKLRWLVEYFEEYKRNYLKSHREAKLLEESGATCSRHTSNLLGGKDSDLLKLTELSQCECEGCAKAVIQGGAVSTDTYQSRERSRGVARRELSSG